MDNSIKQNLVAAGCDEEFIAQFDRCLCDKRKCEKLLAKQRRRLLDEVHQKELNISNLDYLIYMMKKEGLH